MEKHIVYADHPDVSISSFLSALNIDNEDDLAEEFRLMHGEALEIVRPAAVYSPLTPEVYDNIIYLNGVKIEEPFVNKMLSGLGIVVPYVASCGQEIDRWSRSFSDMLEQYAADTLKQMCLEVIREKLFNEVRDKYFSTAKNVSTINPGSLKEWPITGQRSLFKILGGVTNDIGVVLTDSLLMMPTKSVSGIMFQTDQAYHNCQLCPRIDCPRRRAPYGGN